jgi:hypothetical protein
MRDVIPEGVSLQHGQPGFGLLVSTRCARVHVRTSACARVNVCTCACVHVYEQVRTQDPNKLLAAQRSATQEFRRKSIQVTFAAQSPAAQLRATFARTRKYTKKLVQNIEKAVCLTFELLD